MDSTRAAAQLIFEARRSRTTIPRLPEGLRPKTKEAAIAIQQAVTGLLGKQVLGWKCSLPKPDRIPCAPIFDVYAQGTVPVVRSGDVKIVEPEIAFVAGRDLAGRDVPYSESEILAAIASAHLVVEIIGSRFSEFLATDFHEKTADHIVNESLVVGPEIPMGVARGVQGFKFTVSSAQGILSTAEGRHPDGGPWGGLVWLVNYLRQEGTGIGKGAVITTGSFAGFVEVPVDQPLTLTYGSLGAVEIRLESMV